MAFFPVIHTVDRRQKRTTLLLICLLFHATLGHDGRTALTHNIVVRKEMMPRKRSEFILGLVCLSIVLVLFTRRPSDVPDHIQPTGLLPIITEVTTDDRVDEPPNQIRQISVLGERNSGTRWTFE